LVELVVLSLVLVPLLLLLPLLGKYQDVAHATQMASRYVAFDAMVRNNAQNAAKPRAQLEEEVRRRFFSDPEAPVKTRDVAFDQDGHRNVLWRNPDNAPMIARFSDVRVALGIQPAGDRAPFTPGLFPELGGTGIYTAGVSVAIANVPQGIRALEPFDRLNLVIQRRAAILVDGWSGRSPAAVQGKLDDARVFPGSLLRPLSGILAPLFHPPSPAMGIEMGNPPPKLGQLDFWADVVPADRLGLQR
jgi:hypothetical protein